MECAYDFGLSRQEIDAILDMGRTSINITGDLAGAAIVAKSEKAIDMSKWS